MHAFLRGLRRPLAGFSLLLGRPRLWPWAALPLLVATLLYLLLFIGGFTALLEWRVPEAQWAFWGPLGGWLAKAVNFAGPFGLKLLVGVAGMVFAYFTFTAAGLALASPFNEWLTEKVEADVTGQPAEPPPAGLRAAAHGLWGGIVDGLRLAGQQLGFMLLALPFLLVPVVGALPLFLVGAYFAARNFLEVPTGRLYWRRERKRALCRARRLELLGYGVAMQLLFMIPFAGLLTLPVGVVGITLLYLDARRDAPPALEPPDPEPEILPDADIASAPPAAAQPNPR